MMNEHSRSFGMETSKPRSVGGTLRRLWRYFRQYSWVLLLVAFLVIASTYMQVLIPDLTGQAVDCFLGPISIQATAGEPMAASQAA